MSWDYKFTLDFGLSGSAASRFAHIGTRLFSNAVLGTMRRITIYDYNLEHLDKYQGSVVLCRDLQEDIIDFNSAFPPSLIETYTQEYYQFEGLWDVPRFYDSKEGEEKVSYFALLNVWGTDFGKPWFPHPTHAIFEAPNFHHYYITPNSSGVEEQNLELLLGELETIANVGVIAMYGNDGDVFNPMEIRFRYHRQFSGFLQDVSLEVSDETSAESLVMDALKTSENIGFRRPNDGLMVYSRFGTAGALGAFYKQLILQHSPSQYEQLLLRYRPSYMERSRPRQSRWSKWIQFFKTKMSGKAFR